ncbi:ABC transporter permease [Reyranella sp.]|jgi:peptide/nickel transport system permease protein|uniref:ABC transporter permease n=1 Tax=Reyranella sp. TaxID=1929291 RepID=UPI000BCDF9AC|nr:ABC transporter permease [Reyranella sp.]OYY40286.1 MAG: peptide ABC transporter [Rhodospirillales bacterium 35-66-84]OYZ92838.1 MAG: peptide ABC transporter [Rhodospirillales bacterium 24-66-33]OZB22559.1 MAG: peptide ABC transporter [Rhodospirillales bacterium 39-66-50]HQS18919.1 ABC transporter permease [Reyranella sp.]HQT12312.1 ABC transporter permease [Reyranella sp.]
MPWLARQMVRLVVVLFCVTLLTYMIVNILPGDVAIVILGSLATPEDIAGLRADLGLDRPMLVRYFDWLGSALSGDLGRSYRNGEPVVQAILDRLPVSLQLMVMAQVIALGIAIPVALLSVRRPGGIFDRISASAAFGFLAMPNFMLGIVLIYLFSVTFDLLPATGFTPMSEGLWDNFESMILPSLTLGLIEWTVLMRVLRSDLLTTLKEDFILLARAKGLPQWRVLLQHALRPSSFTLITILGLNIGGLIGGAVIVEQIFALPGVGRLLLGGIFNRDLILVQGTVAFIAVGFVVINFLVDMLYAVLDPRVRHVRFRS